jgi:putative tryptophan/tyrosine transport system substrate-binding protein
VTTRRALAGFAAAVVAAVMVACGFSPASAQKREPMPRVGILTPVASAAAKPLWDAFREAMKELGYVEGKSVVYEYRSAEGQLDRLPQLAAELAKIPLKVMVVASTPGNLAAKKATTTIPIVMVGVGDPVRVGLVSNLGRPGGNITGFTNLTGQITAKRLQLLKELIPTATRIAAIGNPGDPNSLIQIQDAEAAARELKVQLRVFTVLEAAQLDPAFEAARSWRAQALMRFADTLQLTLRTRTIELAAKSRMPVMYASRTDVEAGGLIGYGVDPLETYKRAATYVDRILRGAKPGELPVQQPTKLELAVNLKTAAALNIKIPQAILVQADQVVQ